MFHFFIYDSLKIIILLLLMITIVGFLRTWIPTQKIRQWLNKRGILGNLLAAAFGALTPFCSCSSIPIFFSFLKAQVPLGIAFSFLITSPIINEYLVVLMLGFFGLKITLLYILSGLTIGVGVGYFLGLLNLERFLVPEMVKSDAATLGEGNACTGFIRRLTFGVNEALATVQRLLLWILLGVGLGALIHNFIPQSLVEEMISKTGFLAVPLAVLLGIPLYGSCAAILPVAIVLFQKGFPLGTALAFMMAVSALSLPEAVLLRRAIKLKLLILFFSLTALAIIFTGYLFNFLAANQSAVK